MDWQSEKWPQGDAAERIFDVIETTLLIFLPVAHSPKTENERGVSSGARSSKSATFPNVEAY